METDILISIIIPAYNAQHLIGNLLQSLIAQSYPAKNIQIIVVDNGSTDNTADICRQFPVNYIYYDKQNKPAAARNAGLKTAKGRYILFVDSDCLAHKDLVYEHVKKHTELEQSGLSNTLIGGAVEGINSNFWAVCDDMCSWYQFHPKLNSSFNYRLMPSNNMSINSAFLKKIGGFNEALRYGEDSYMCLLIKKMGYKVYFLSDAVVYHINRTTFHGFMKRAKEYSDVQFESIANTNIIKKNKIIISLFSQLKFFLSRFSKLCYMILRSGRLAFFPALPFIIMNQIYFGYHKIKNQLNL